MDMNKFVAATLAMGIEHIHIKQVGGFAGRIDRVDFQSEPGADHGLGESARQLVEIAGPLPTTDKPGADLSYYEVEIRTNQGDGIWFTVPGDRNAAIEPIINRLAHLQSGQN